MPTTTFFRLPEEKRQRLIDAAWEEFSQVSFVDASINKIIRRAQIPRGSFYQYFADKQELFQYLLGDTRGYFASVLAEILQESGGDLFAVPGAVFDRFLNGGETTDPGLERCIRVMQCNHGMDMQWLVGDQPRLLPERFRDQVDSTCFRDHSPSFLDHAFFLLVAALGFAVMETLWAPEQWENQRRIMQERVELIKYGCLTQQAAPVHAQEGGAL